MMTRRQFKGRGPQCYYCKQYGHMQKICTERTKAEEEKSKHGGSEKGSKRPKPKGVGLVTSHVLGVTEPAHDWIVDSGATCHICNSKELFEELHPLSKPQKVTLGDGRTVEAMSTGVIEVKLKLPGGESKIGRLGEVLYVPTLAYNLLSVTKATEARKMVKFGETHGEIIDEEGNVVAMASKTGSLYYLCCEPVINERINLATDQAGENL